MSDFPDESSCLRQHEPKGTAFSGPAFNVHFTGMDFYDFRTDIKAEPQPRMAYYRECCAVCVFDLAVCKRRGFQVRPPFGRESNI